MINAPKLLKDLKVVLRKLEDDIRERAGEVPELKDRLKREYDAARAAQRTGSSFTEWRDDQVTQAAVGWILGCVFVRFIEDNGLIPEPWIAGPGDRLAHAKDQHTHYFRQHPRETDREYLLHVFNQVRKLPAMAELFDERHNPIWFLEPSGDGAELLLQFFQKIDAAKGGLVHDFTDPDWNTRFLGDLYQDLSENARKKYALLQTPEFIEEFILDRTLDPAIDTFGLKVLRMIDPTCGSGHFLLGGFHRILARWQELEPGTNIRELVQRTLTSIYGVDLNPFSIAISRFRLLIAALKAADIRHLKDAPNFHFNLAVGDSLLHGFSTQQLLTGGTELDEKVGHVYRAEDDEALGRIFSQKYHAVVGNPPYITVKDKALNQAYREKYGSCHRAYSLAVPFMERFFTLAMKGGNGSPAGFVGKITANSFMKREFGKKLIEEYLPRWNLTHVVDTSGAYIPGHGTPTVILFGTNAKPSAGSVRTVMGIKGEPATPDLPANGMVWRAILDQIDRPGSESEFVSVANTQCDRFYKHPWSLQGGGATEVKSKIESAASSILFDCVAELGRTTHIGEDEAFVLDKLSARRFGFGGSVVPFIEGEAVRDFSLDLQSAISCVFPYDKDTAALKPDLPSALWDFLWPRRTNLRNRRDFGQYIWERGLEWWEHSMFFPRRFVTPLGIPFASVATQNHFVLDRGGSVFKQSAPAIKLPEDAVEDGYLKLLGYLNSSVGCFWMKQVFHCKGSTVDQHGARQTTVPFEDFYDFDGTKLKQFPVPSKPPLTVARELDRLASEAAEDSPHALCVRNLINATDLAESKQRTAQVGARMISLQEELDWQCYRLYGLVDAEADLEWPEDDLDSLPSINLGERPFEIVMASQMEAGELETTWFKRHGSVPITGIPKRFSSKHRKLWERRIAEIENNKNTNHIERPEYKRRWSIEPWEDQVKTALESWLQNRIEYALSGRDLMAEAREETVEGSRLKVEGGKTPELLSCAQLADGMRTDKDFLQVAGLYRGREDFDLVKLVTELVESQSVPNLPVFRYKPSGLRKREAWEETWELQRKEDAVEAEVRNQNTEASEEQFKELIRQAQKEQVGDIPVPPKYASADFLKSTCWKLRGKLDVPKERYVLFPKCERDGDPTSVLTWAGWNHLEQAQAIAGYYEVVRNEGWSDERRIPLLAGVLDLVPWLKQWHNTYDATYGTRLGDFFEDFVESEARAMGKTVDELCNWGRSS